ncbi:chloramphenicol acetyltransferase [Cribrihabitans pelagius]|uniref:chloramphenicol acetyltransferase n=1 Tax=Cribrihabitans pelagius TaxID=1765746 RepID=UPI003B5CABDB
MARLTAEAPFLHPDCQITVSSFGAFVEIGAGSRITGTVFGGCSCCDRTCDIANAEIGTLASIASFTPTGATGHPMEKASLHHFHYRAAKYRDDAENGAGCMACRAGRRAYAGHVTWFGHAAILKPEMTIGHGAVVASGAIVTKDAARYTIAGRNTAKVIRRRFTEAVAERMMELAWWDWSHDPLRRVLPDFRQLRAGGCLEKYA